MIVDKVWESVEKLTGRVPAKLNKSLNAAFQNKITIRAAEYAARLALGFLLSSARIFGNYAPFGIGFISASGTGLGGMFAIIGAILGAIGTGGFVWATKYVSISVLIFSAAFVFKDTKLYLKRWFMPLIGGLMTACTGFVYAADAGWSISATAFYIMETVLAAGSAYFYMLVLSPGKGQEEGYRRRVSLLIFLSTLFIAISGLRIFGFISIGRVLAVIAVMTAGYRGGMTWGSVAGIAFGISMDAASASPPFFTAAYSIAGLISGVFSNGGRLFFAVTYIISNAIAALWGWDSIFREAVLYETFIASVAFILLPSSLFISWKESFLKEISFDGAIKSKEYIKAKAERAARAFRDIYELLRHYTEGGKNDNDISSVFDMAADMTCRKCRMSVYCWQREYIGTFNAMNDASKPMMKRGMLLEEDFPAHFRDKCLDIKAFTSAANIELKNLLLRIQFKNRLKENQDVLYRQFLEMSSVLKNMAEELDVTSVVERELERKLKLYLRGIDADITAGVFSDKNGRLHIELEGSGIHDFKKDKSYLDKLSAVVGKRLCESDKYRKGKLWILEAEPLAASVGIASIRKKDNGVSGDSGTYFKTEEGILCVLLSDGMGTGIEAKKDSASAVKILERLLKAGIPAVTALKILSSVMLLKGEERITLATVDLMCVNLFSGETQMFKYGAAPSYVKKGKTVRRVTGESIAAGINAAELCTPDHIKVKLEAGSFAAIISDGVVSGNDDVWIAEAIEEYIGDDARELARNILDKAAKKHGCDDDMTVLIIAVENRK